MPRWFALVLCGVGATVIAVGLRQSSRGRATQGWTRTQGRVTAAHVEELHGPAEAGGSRFRPVVRYTYEAGGRTHASERVSVGLSPAPDLADRAQAEDVIRRFRVGAEVDVWFDPRDPGQAVLERGVGRLQVYAIVAIGLALVGAGLFALSR